jgi:cysteine desulfurase
MNLPCYFDFAATTKVDSRVAELMMRVMLEGFGNSGSRTHIYGSEARGFVDRARANIATMVDADDDEVIFTSGATEANNIALLGIAPYGVNSGRKHIIVSAVEHKAILEPAELLAKQGFEVSVVRVLPTGIVDLDHLSALIRDETLMVSIMHVNNETGIIQPLNEIANILRNSDSYFHVDAAQGYGKELNSLREKRIDLISVSGHKIYAPQGIGALVIRKRASGERPPLQSLVKGGGQERGLRPGTVSVPLASALGEASRLALEESAMRNDLAKRLEDELINFINQFDGQVNGDRSRAIPQIVNASFKGLDSEAFIVATKSLIAISNGAACSSHSYERSHVLEAMGLETRRISGGIRFSFSHESSPPDWEALGKTIEAVRF